MLLCNHSRLHLHAHHLRLLINQTRLSHWHWLVYHLCSHLHPHHLWILLWNSILIGHHSCSSLHHGWLLCQRGFGCNWFRSLRQLGGWWRFNFWVLSLLMLFITLSFKAKVACTAKDYNDCSNKTDCSC